MPRIVLFASNENIIVLRKASNMEETQCNSKTKFGPILIDKVLKAATRIYNCDSQLLDFTFTITYIIITTITLVSTHVNDLVLVSDLLLWKDGVLNARRLISILLSWVHSRHVFEDSGGFLVLKSSMVASITHVSSLPSPGSFTRGLHLALYPHPRHLSRAPFLYKAGEREISF